MITSINTHIEKFPKGVLWTTSGDVLGMVIQGRKVTEAIEIDRDVAPKLIEARARKTRP